MLSGVCGCEFVWVVCLFTSSCCRSISNTHIHDHMSPISNDFSISFYAVPLYFFLLPVYILQQIVCIYAFPLHLFELILKHFTFFARWQMQKTACLPQINVCLYLNLCAFAACKLCIHVCLLENRYRWLQINSRRRKKRENCLRKMIEINRNEMKNTPRNKLRPIFCEMQW